MAKFTTQQANECIVTKCDSFKVDGVHQYWEIDVVDNNGNVYQIIEEQISGNANTTALKASIKSNLMNIDKLPDPEPIKEITTESKDDILGGTVG